MTRIYFDNAATTPLRAEVITEITHVLQTEFGNPSSTHSFGRSAKTILETARKKIAKLLNAQPSEIIFTSGATEANNWILSNAIKQLNIKRIVSTKIEHHAVLHTLEHLAKTNAIELVLMPVDAYGQINLLELENILADNKPTFISLMHVNNEVGTVLPIQKITEITKKYHAFVHSDTVQSIGKIKIDVQEQGVDFLVGAAHKFHGPKGVGFAFVKKNTTIAPFIFGGEQEKGLRAGTEGVHNIAGMAKALELSIENLEADQKHILALKKYCIQELKNNFLDCKIIGGEDTFYNIVNILLPFPEEKATMLLFQLDIQGIAVSIGSACQSGSSKRSHVLQEILTEEELKKPTLRVSFSHYNNFAEIDRFIKVLKNN